MHSMYYHINVYDVIINTKHIYYVVLDAQYEKLNTIRLTQYENLHQRKLPAIIIMVIDNRKWVNQLKVPLSMQVNRKGGANAV